MATVPGNSINEATTGICGFTGTAFTGTPATNHAVIVGGSTSSTLTNVGPTATALQVLQSAGSSADPVFSTATYPATTTVNQILYSSATNVVGQITAANSASLVTSSAGVPSLAAMTSGQLIIGNTGGTPTAAVPTSTGGNFITGAGTLLYIPANYKPGVSNIGITYAGGTFTVNGFDGTALSATNPGYVTFQSTSTPGKIVTIAVTANQTFTDGSSGGTDNQRFGLISGNVWGANDIPFFLYAVSKSDQTAVAFMISRDPTAVVAPAAAGIGKSGSIVNVDQKDMFSLASITTSDYAAQPAVYVGCFRMQFVGATDSWTVQTLSTVDGVGNNFDNRLFAMPKAVQQAATNSFFIANGGTAPIWTNQALSYLIKRNGQVTVAFDANSISTAGVGAVTAGLSLPYVMPTLSSIYIGNALFLTTGTNTFTTFGVESNSSASPLALFWQSGIVGNTANATFASGTTFKTTFIYNPFT